MSTQFWRDGDGYTSASKEDLSSTSVSIQMGRRGRHRSPSEQLAAGKLGWDEEKWDEGESTTACETRWEAMTEVCASYQAPSGVCRPLSDNLSGIGR